MALKDLLLITRDGLGMFFIIGFPVMIGVFFGSMYNFVGSGEGARIKVAVVDEDQTDWSTRFTEALADSDNSELETLERAEAFDRVRRGQIAGLIVIPEGYGSTAGLPWEEAPPIGLGIDPSRKAEAGLLEGLVMRASGEVLFARFASPSIVLDLTRDAREEVRKIEDPTLGPLLVRLMDHLEEVVLAWEEEITAEQAEAANGEWRPDAEFLIANVESIDVTYEPAEGSAAALVRQMRSKWDISFPQGMLWGVMACSATFAIAIVRERKQGTLLRLQAAPVSRNQVLLGKGLACFLAVLGVIAVLVALGLSLGMRPRSPLLLAVASVSVAWCFVGLMMLVSVVGRSEEAVSGAAWGGNMLMAMFGGGMIPLAFLPDFMVALSHLSPVKWSILAVEGAIWRGFTPTEMAAPCLILLAIGTVGTLLGAARFMRLKG